MELDFPKTKAGELKEKSLRTTLQYVQAQGHPYVEIREEGKKNRLILFCILCPAPFHSDSCLFDHLKGRRHTERLAMARLTLLKPNPWPFNDGMIFFHDQQSKSVPASDRGKSKSVDVRSSNVGPVASTQSSLKIKGNASRDKRSGSSTLDGDKTGGILVIPDVMQKGKASDLVVRHIGVGRIGGRFREKHGGSSQVCRVWCEWLGNVDSTTEDFDMIPKHNFAIVTFSYDYNLGRMGLVDGFDYMLPSAPGIDPEKIRPRRGRKRKLVSDPKNTSKALRIQDHSSGKESQSSKSSKSNVLFTRDEDRLARIIASKTLRKRLRKQYRFYAKRYCEICRKRMLLDKDVAALLNRKTGMLVCSSRNSHGLFHVYHISCLIQWLLHFEAEFAFDDQNEIKMAKAKKDGQKDPICSAFCPECQATGIIVKGDERENLHASLSQIKEYTDKMCEARNAWITSPEMVDNCSIGFHFPQEYYDARYQEDVDQLKILHFYRAIE